MPGEKKVYEPTDEQVGRGAYYTLREIQGWNSYRQTFLKILGE